MDISKVDLQENLASEFKYRHDAEAQGIAIEKYIGNALDVRIPAKIEGEPVVVIERFNDLNSPFSSISTLLSIFISFNKS